jgi:hypothetical protein
VAHACNPTYSGGRLDQEDLPRQIVGETLSQKNSSQKRAGGVAQGVGPEFKPQDLKKNKNWSMMMLYNSEYTKNRIVNFNMTFYIM